MSAFVMTPATRPAESHTITRSVPLHRKFAASISGAPSAIVTSFSRTAGNNLSTYIALSPGSFHHPNGQASFRAIAAGWAAPASLEGFSANRSLSTAERNTQHGHDARDREREAAKTHSDQ